MLHTHTHTLSLSNCRPLAAKFSPPSSFRPIACSAIGLFLALGLLPGLTSTAQAGQTVIIDGDVSGGVSGNNNPPYPVVWPPANLSDPNNNTVIINSGTVSGDVDGGDALAAGSNPATATGNSVTINGGSVGGSVYGGYAFSDSGAATASGNIVTINGGSVDGDVYGGYAQSNSGAATASGNIIHLRGGMIGSSVFGGRAASSTGDVTATNNEIHLYDGVTLNATSTYLYGGLAISYNGGVRTSTGNTLNLHAASSTALTVRAVGNFQTYNFYLSDTLGASNPASDPAILTVTNAVDLSASEVHVAIEGKSSPLRVNDEVNLIKSAGGLTGPSNTETKGQGMQGVTLKYEFDLDSTTYPDQLVAKVTKAALAEESKSLSEGYLSSTAFLTQASDFLTRRGVSAAQEEVKNARLAQGREYSSFIALGGGKVRNETGSHIDVSGYHLLVGLASAQKLHNSELTLAGFIEYGEGDYTSHNSFNSGKIKGKGDTRYKGIGLLARNEYPSGLYIDGSLRIGQTDADFKANLGQQTKFDTKSTYAGAHLGIGKNWALNETGTLDTYGQILYTRQQSDSVTLSTGEKVKFESIDSERIRIGTRYQHKLTNAFTGYAGIAYDHEFGGKAKAKTNGYKIDAPTLKGGSGMFEIGLTGKPSANKPLFLDLGIQGYAGKREGVTGSLRVNYRF